MSDLTAEPFIRDQPSTARVKTPTVLQMEITECGAAALSIILAYYGRHISLEEVRAACGVSRDGSKAINMMKAARNYGLIATGAQVDEIEELKQVRCPYIVFWEFNHFVVVEGIGDDKIFINDPAIGQRTVDYQEFSRAFTGVLLLMEPGPDFKQGGTTPSVIKSLRDRLGNATTSLAFVTLATFALVIPGLLAPGFMKIFIDDVLIRDMEAWFIPLVLCMAVTACFASVLSWTQQIHLLRMQLKLMLTSSANFLWHIFSLPMSFFAQRFSGDIQERIGANSRIASFLSGQLSSSAISLITLVFYAFVMALLSWTLALIVIVVGAIKFTMLYLVAQKIANLNRRFLQEWGRLTGISMNGLQTIETLKATASEDDYFLRWASCHAKTINTQQYIMFYNQLLMVGPTLLSGLTTITTLGLGSWQIMQGDLTIGTLVAFQLLSASFNAPLGTLLGLAGNIQKIRGDLTRLDDVLQHPREPRVMNQQIIKDSDCPLQLSGKIELKQVTFGYSQLEDPFIDKFNLSIERGARIALVGSTGSGKSTLAKLVCGLYPPWSGKILFDGTPIDKIPRSVLAQSLSLVDQDIFLFEGTIRDNLTLWNNEIPDEDLLRALKDACVEDAVLERGGLDSEMTENGANFSGGQRQRIEIARALVNNPKILILDEGTSALDAITEHKIYTNLKRRNCTLFIIAHRVSTIRDCDEIIVLQQGKIIEKGTHEAMIQQNGFYQQLIKLEQV